MRRSWRPNRTALYWPRLLWPSALCLSRSPGLLNRMPRGPLCWLSLLHLISNFSGPQLSYFLFSPNYIIVQSPTQSPTQYLEWLFWSSSSGNNCHAVHRSFSSGASVYECTMGILPCLMSSAKSTNTISFDYWPLECVTSFRRITLEWHVWPGRRSKYNKWW